MYPKLFKIAPSAAFVAGLFLSAFAPATLKAQKIDLNANGMSDVWEQTYSLTNLPSAVDSDGDGAPNWLESIAGTDPFSAASVPKIPFVSHTSSNVTVTVACAIGKQYQLQSIQPVAGLPWTNWVVEATTVARSGTNISLSAPASSVPKFFRIGIADVDTDGDGVNDWEEYQLGLDPFQPKSNGQLDQSGQALNDYAYATGRFASQNIFTISATDLSTVQPDAGQSAQDVGVLTVTRGGFPLKSTTVTLGIGGPGAGYATENLDILSLPRSLSFPVGVSSKTINVIPLANTNLKSSVIAMSKLLPGAGYTVGQASNASVVIYPSATAKGTGLTGQYYTNANVTYTSANNFNTLVMTRVDTNVDFTWGTASLPFANGGYYCVRWTGQVMPQYSETYTFVANTDDGVKLWVNDQLIINNWISKSASDSLGTITLQAGVRYNIKMEYFNLTGSAVAHLSWYSPSQSKQPIPTSRLYPASVTPAPTSIVSPLTAFAFLGQPFSYTNVGANSATFFTATGLPPGLTNNATNGIISGIPNVAGDFQVSLTASNSVGVSASIVDLQVLDTGSSVTREVWTGVAGSNISDIPLGVPANVTNTLGTLEGITDYGDNYGERIRGYLTAPATGNYYFWLAASDSAELWISNDGEPANKVRRAFVTPTNNPVPPPALGTGSRQWNVQGNQRSGWLSLVAGQRYYAEILHKASAGSGDNWAVGYLADPSGTNNTPGGIVPGYLLSPFFTTPPSVTPGTLYVANLLPTIGVTNMSYGSASMRLSADNSRATINFSYNGIISPVIGIHVDNDPYLGSPSQIMFDISAASPQPDGSYVWFIKAVGTLSAADVLQVLSQGKGYMSILSGSYPDGELMGHFELAEGSSTFTPPPPPPAWTDDHTSTNAAARFLTQATFGPSPADLTNVISIGYTNWLLNQFSLPPSYHLSLMRSNVSSDPTLPYSGNTLFNDWWQLSVTAPDQLRQRIAFALSEILVVSDQGSLQDNGIVLSSYYDTLLDNAFGNFRDLLKAVSLHPAMGLYLNMQGNDKGNIVNGTHANENYAREIMQLFSIGLNREWPDGSLVMTSSGNLVPTYDQNVINGFAATFTGWNYYQPNQGNGRLPTSFSPSANYTNPMVLVPSHHDLNSKLLLDNVVLPPALGSAADSLTTNFDNYCSQDLELALNSIYNNQNVGPFICRQLIQRLVTSHPSSNYLYRVVNTFNNNGSGVRGDMTSVIQAILLDYEARSTAMLSVPTFGKQREPLLRVTAATRAFPAPAPLTGTYSQTTNGTITITTPVYHRLTNNEIVVLNFTDASTNVPPDSQAYTVTTPSITNITIGAPGISSGTYTQMVNATISNMLTASIVTTNVITVAISGHGLTIGNPVYLNFISGGAASGIYQIINTTNVNSFSAVTADATPHGGACLIPKLTGGGFMVTLKTNVTYSTTLPHGLSPGDAVFVNFTAAGSPPDGQYTVATVPDATHFTFIIPTTNNQTQNGATVYPLIAPPLNRSGTVTINWNTWVLNATDTGGTFSLSQTPLNSPTVFNFFFPDYKFPGALSTAGLTTPEFQLTSDTTAAFQMNFLEGGILGNTSNTNGLSSFNNGGGAIVMDISPWMTPAFTSTAGLPGLVDALSTRLCAGQLSSGARTQIINYATTLAYTTPTAGQMRDRVRAVVHLLLSSPDFTIQR